MFEWRRKPEGLHFIVSVNLSTLSPEDMRRIRFLYKDSIINGVLNDDGKIITDEPAERDIFLRSDEVRLLAPVTPSKIVLVGLNYRDHAKELDMFVPEEPIIFMKPPTAVIGPEENIIYPACSQRLDYEAELGVVIKDVTRHVSRKEAAEHILGYVCLNDVTARDIQKKDGQWTRAKSFDTFVPVGPWIETDIDPTALGIRSYLNGELKQDSTTSEFIFTVPELIEFISGVMTLLPGDVIATGTPPGIGPMEIGDEVVIEIDGIGRLKNRVVGEHSA